MQCIQAGWDCIRPKRDCDNCPGPEPEVQELGMETSAVICAWCGCEIGTIAGPDESHGICDGCRKLHFPEYGIPEDTEKRWYPGNICPECGQRTLVDLDGNYTDFRCKCGVRRMS